MSGRRETETDDSASNREAFLVWANILLGARDMQASNTGDDWADGLLLINLLEMAYHGEVNDYHTKPATTLERLENVVLALQFFKKHSDQKDISANPTDFVQSKAKRTFPVLWRIYNDCAMQNRRRTTVQSQPDPPPLPPPPTGTVVKVSKPPEVPPPPSNQPRLKPSQQNRSALTVKTSFRDRDPNRMSTMSNMSNNSIRGSVNQGFMVGPLSLPISSFMLPSPDVSPMPDMSPIQLTPDSHCTPDHSPKSVDDFSRSNSRKPYRRVETVDDSGMVVRKMTGFKPSKKTIEAFRESVAARQEEERAAAAEAADEPSISVNMPDITVGSESLDILEGKPIHQGRPSVSTVSQFSEDEYTGRISAVVQGMKDDRAATRRHYEDIEKELFQNDGTATNHGSHSRPTSGSVDSDMGVPATGRVSSAVKKMHDDRSAHRNHYDDIQAELFGDGKGVPPAVPERGRSETIDSDLGGPVQANASGRVSGAVRNMKDDRTQFRDHYGDIEKELFGTQ